MKRGDVVVAVLPGDVGKPRPALVVQSDLFAAIPSVLVLPMTTDQRPSAALFRLAVEPNPRNGLEFPSDVMVDKIQSISKAKIGKRIGALAKEEMDRVDSALRLVLGLS